MASQMRRPRRFMNQINVVPYIDVMLVLLIIFMVTAPLITPSQVELPKVGQASAPPQSPLEVIIHADKTISLLDTGKSGEQRKLSRSELIDVIRQKQAGNPDQPVVIAADRAVRYEEVMSVMDILRENKVEKIGLAVKSKGGG